MAFSLYLEGNSVFGGIETGNSGIKTHLPASSDEFAKGEHCSSKRTIQINIFIALL